MKVKNILKLFAVFLGVQSMCPIDAIGPTEIVATLAQVFVFYEYSDEDKQSIFKEALGHFGLNNFSSYGQVCLLEKKDENGKPQSQIDQIFKQDIPGLSQKIKGFIMSDSGPFFQLPLDVYCACSKGFSFTQGKDNVLSVPAVTLNGQFQMIASEMQFRHTVSQHESGIQTIRASTYDSNGVELAIISIDVDQNSIAQDRAELVWVRDWVTEAGVDWFIDGGLEGRVYDRQIMIERTGYSNTLESDKNELMIAQDPLGSFRYQDQDFPALHTLAHMLLVFTVACQKELGDESHELSNDDIWDKRLKIALKLFKHNYLGRSFYIPHNAFFRTQSSSTN